MKTILVALVCLTSTLSLVHRGLAQESATVEQQQVYQRDLNASYVMAVKDSGPYKLSGADGSIAVKKNYFFQYIYTNDATGLLMLRVGNLTFSVPPDAVGFVPPNMKAEVVDVYRKDAVTFMLAVRRDLLAQSNTQQQTASSESTPTPPHTQVELENLAVKTYPSAFIENPNGGGYIFNDDSDLGKACASEYERLQSIDDPLLKRKDALLLILSRTSEKLAIQHGTAQPPPTQVALHGTLLDQPAQRTNYRLRQPPQRDYQTDTSLLARTTSAATVTPNAYGLGVNADEFGRPHTYRLQDGERLSPIFQDSVERDAYGMGVHADEFGRPVYDGQP
jgi:hypothetical protein